MGEEGIGQLTAEDLEAIGGKSESTTEFLKRLFAESEAKLDAAEAEMKKAQVLGRVSILAIREGPYITDARYIAERAFDIHDALEAEYERRKARG